MVLLKVHQNWSQRGARTEIKFVTPITRSQMLRQMVLRHEGIDWIRFRSLEEACEAPETANASKEDNNSPKVVEVSAQVFN